MLDITLNVSNQAIENRNFKKIKIPDNMIASTVMVHDLILVTRNIKDFVVLGIEILNPFDISS